MKKLRLLIVDDHPLMRRALKTAVSTESDIEVIDMASDGQQAQQLIAQTHPDMVLLDLLMPHGGADMIATLHKEHPSLRILVVTSVSEGDDILRAVQAGAHGYITKEADYEELLLAIRTVAVGNSYLPPPIAAQLMASIQQTAATNTDDKPLTPREQEIFNLLGEGLTNNQIAEKLTISDATVRVHLHNIIKKFGFETRAKAVAYAVRQRMNDMS